MKIEHVSERTFKSRKECEDSIFWIQNNIPNQGKTEYSVFESGRLWRYKAVFEASSCGPGIALFDNQRAV